MAAQPLIDQITLTRCLYMCAVFSVYSARLCFRSRLSQTDAFLTIMVGSRLASKQSRAARLTITRPLQGFDPGDCLRPLSYRRVWKKNSTKRSSNM